MAGEYSDPLHVVMLNPETERSEDVSHAVATELLRRLGIEGQELPASLEGFIDRHVGPDRQLRASAAALPRADLTFVDAGGPLPQAPWLESVGQQLRNARNN
ncbi:hypothetical protein WDM22_38380 [Bradyrhizobium septentrionale]|uniref:hypothetical protein n=1 Tax=Bradyrhizobium septentrionale TaxID=1404411 RepID=UPI0030CBD432